MRDVSARIAMLEAELAALRAELHLDELQTVVDEIAKGLRSGDLIVTKDDTSYRASERVPVRTVTLLHGQRGWLTLSFPYGFPR